MRLLIHSNAPWMKTGYGQQTDVWASRFAALGHDVAIHGYAGAQHLTVEWKGITVYPAGVENAMGMDGISYFCELHRADAVISLCDAWALSPRMMALLPNVVCWTPVDAEPLGKGLRDFFAESGARPLAISRYGQRLFAEAGLDAGYIPHGIDCSVFAPPPDRDALREASGFGPGTFVVGMNQANRSGLRKALPEQLMAFARFRARHPDSKLILHMARDHPKGQDLPLLLDKLGVGLDAVFFPDSGAYAAGAMTTEDMPLIYGGLDVLLGCAMAGGFELPLLEAQACGTPVIATDGSAMTEVAGPHSWLVGGQQFWVEERHEGFWTMPFVHEIDAALEEAWQAREDGTIQARREASRQHALQYDADLILRDYWAPFLAELEAGRDVVHAAGLKWRVAGHQDHGDRLGPHHEQTVEAAILDLLPEGGVFLDVGAHVGHYTLRAAGKASRVIAVEPSPATAERLLENLALNGIGNVIILEVAAWDEAAPLRLESEHERDGDTRVVPDPAGEVAGMPLDDLLIAEPRIDLVKLDVEGADLHALRGMAATLARCRPVMVIEDHSVYECYERDELREVLAGLGYGMRELGMYGCAPYLLAEPLPSAARKVWSPVMFRGEQDMLEMRLEETAGLVDRHVVVEAGLTHRGHPKPLHLRDNLGRFEAHPEMTLIAADLDPDGEPWANEHAQRDAAWPVIDAEAADDDVVLICDVDEIPSRSLLERARAGHLPEVCAVRLRTFIHAVDWEVPQDAIPPACVVATAGYIRRHGGSLAAIRDRRGEYEVIEDGGWHFSWLGGPEAALEKLETATCHTELLGTPEGDLIADGTRYRTGEHGGGLPVVPADVDETWPAFIRERRCPPQWFRPRSQDDEGLSLGEMAVVVTAFRRPYYLEPVLRSWAAADGVRDLRRFAIALGRSDRQPAMMKVISEARPGFPGLKVFHDSDAAAAAPGMHRSVPEAVARLLEDPQVRFLVFGEEDIVVSDDVLAYMRWAAERFAEDSEVLAVCAHSRGGQGWDAHEPAQDAGADQQAVRLESYFNAWVWGTWRDRWEKIIEPSWDYNVTSGGPFDSGWDWNLATRVLPQHHMLCVVPQASRSQNTGLTEGWASTAASFAFSQAQSFRERRGIVTYRLEEA